MAGFYHPEWLILLVLLPIIYYWYLKQTERKKQEAMIFSNLSFIRTALGDTKGSKRPRNILLISLLALGLIIVALADPHIPLEQTKEGVNVVLALDISGSMQATDYTPTRIDAAKKAAETLLRQLDQKDYAGVVTFESGATSAAYLSPDKDRVIEKMNAIEPKSGSTAIGDGLALSIDMAESIPNRKKVVILLSDGDNNSGVISPEQAMQFAKDRGIQVFTVGLGSDRPVVLGYDWFGNPQYATLNEDTLKSIASGTGGEYFRSVNEKTLSDIYANLNKEIKREKEETSIKDLFIIATLGVLLTELYMRFGKRRIIQ